MVQRARAAIHHHIHPGERAKHVTHQLPLGGHRLGCAQVSAATPVPQRRVLQYPDLFKRGKHPLRGINRIIAIDEQMAIHPLLFQRPGQRDQAFFHPAKAKHLNDKPHMRPRPGPGQCRAATGIAKRHLARQPAIGRGAPVGILRRLHLRHR